MQSNTSMTRHRKLNAGQLETLDLLFKYRYGTTELIAKIKNRPNGTAIRSQLNILYNQGLIERRYSGKDKLQGKFAAYYLLPAGLKALERNNLRADLPASARKIVYRLGLASEAFIVHCLHLFEVGVYLNEIYQKRLKFFTKSELWKYEYFPDPKPDAFVSLNDERGTKRFFLDFIDSNTPGFAITRRIREYIDYSDEDEWSVTQSDFPGILFVCVSKEQEAKLLKRAESLSSDLDIFSTTIKLLSSVDAGGRVWATEANQKDRGEL